MDDERMIWEGRSSRLNDLGFLFACLVFPLALSAWRFLIDHFSRHEITSERIRVTSGFLAKRMDEMELYRVKDSSFEQPFFHRLFGLAHLQIRTSDSTLPRLFIPAMRDAHTVRENLRGSDEKMRERKSVREVDNQ